MLQASGLTAEIYILPIFALSIKLRWLCTSPSNHVCLSANVSVNHIHWCKPITHTPRMSSTCAYPGGTSV